MLPVNLKPLPRIHSFFEANCAMWGVRVILALIEMPDRMVHCIALSHQIEPVENEVLGEKGADYLIQNLEKIPMTDVRALKQVDKELNRQLKIKAERMHLGLDVSAQDEAIFHLIRYRKETTRPNGSIRDFFSVEMKEYQRHRAAITRLMNKARRECPEAHYYVKAHLLSGIYFYWSSKELQLRQ
jgi:hypothetical protein